MELAPFHIDVITVQPGGIQSDFGKTADRVVSEVLGPASPYRPVEAAVRKRAQMSQKNATPALELANAVIENLTKAKPKPILRTGNMSFVLPLVEKWMPTSLKDRLLMKMFGLTELAKAARKKGKP
jgi:short-subunit dehydrogenase